MARSTAVKVEGIVMGLDLNKDNSRSAIAGRRAFKIFSLDEYNNFIEEFDLRGNDTTNLNYCFNDVVWNQRDEHILATAATNGAIVVWNLHRQTNSKQDRVLLDHKRTVNRVNFHFSEPWLISGSQDGTVRCFDLRSKEAGRVYNSNTDSIRDVKFNPHATTTFAAVSENGNVQLWDTRKHDRFYAQYAAHSEPIFSCDWHAEYSWLATSSRDKTIKVWDVTPQRPALKYIIHTFSSVGRIKWRPHFKFHIASTAIVVDRNINVWDIRRPYIPYAYFKGHKDIATDIKWKNDPLYLFSCGRDCYVFRHVFSDAVRPADSVNPHAISVNGQGNILHSQRVHVTTIITTTTTTTTQKVSSKIQELLSSKRPIPVNDTFCQASSRLLLFSPSRSTYGDQDALFFIECAVHYVLHGKTLKEMCEHNSRIAYQLGRHSIGYTWNMIKNIVSSPYFNLDSTSEIADEELDLSSVDNDSFNSVKEVTTTNNDEKKENNNNKDETDAVDNVDERFDDANNDDNNNDNDDDNDDDKTPINDDPSSEQDDELDDDELDEDELDDDRQQSDDYLSDSFLPVGDFIFGDRDMDPFCLDYDTCENLYFSINGIFADKFDLDENEWSIPSEGFAPRHEIKEGPLPPELLPTKIPSFVSYVDTLPRNKFIKSDDGPYILTIKQKCKPPIWDTSELISEALRHHADSGDYQTAVSILLVLGEKRKILAGRTTLDEMIQEQWLLAYLEILNRYKLWNITTKVIQLSWISSVYQLNQLSTSLRTCCGKCRKLMLRCGWSCDRCHTRKPSICSLCQRVVKGMFAWCQGCGHGGHLFHIQSWLKRNRHCPAGCGHICEY